MVFIALTLGLLVLLFVIMVALARVFESDSATLSPADVAPATRST